MNFGEIVETLGGGLSSVVIAALGFLNWQQFKWAREDQKTLLELQKEVLNGLNGTTRALESLTEEIRRNGLD